MLTSIFAIISALLPVAVAALEGFKAISPTTGNLITSIGGAATAFTTEVAANGSSVTALTILSAIQAALSVLQQELAGSPGSESVLVYISALTSAIAAGLAATNISSVDPTKLSPVVPA